MKKLRDVETPLANFFASGVLALGAKLGPLLWQLPPQLGYDAERMEAFFALLPRSTGGGRRLAGGTTSGDRPGVDPAAERRARSGTPSRCGTRASPSDAFTEQLRRHGVALVVADTAGKWPLLEERPPTSCYVRLHGDASSTSAATPSTRSTTGRPDAAAGTPTATGTSSSTSTTT